MRRLTCNLITALLAAITLQGCTFYGGISAHLERRDVPEFYAPNPIGILGIEQKHKRFIGFCEHRSSIPYQEYGWGLNECGIKYIFIP